MLSLHILFIIIKIIRIQNHCKKYICLDANHQCCLFAMVVVYRVEAVLSPNMHPCFLHH